MPSTITYKANNIRTSSAIELVQWPIPSSNDESIGQAALIDNVFSVQTTRLLPSNTLKGSSLPYQAFNLGLHVGDCPERVKDNRRYLQSLLPVNTQIQWLNQVHGNEVVEISTISAESLTADAAITQEKNVCLAIMTADCLPILLASKSGNEIAAIHGGWRPLSANIIQNTITKMNTPTEDIYAWLGPCISKNAFEVGSEVKAQFVEQCDSFNCAFIATSTGKYLADLHKIAEIQLNALGINAISTLPECTYTNTDKYYSYRKDSVTGRMATLICLL
ncbi:peptidoglycan editing factor PgeF [Colwellia sp. 4_MG-2023]|jgi:YfiH family protein|uniref:peptidoglycan editing factor PgeF n=1 Tax=unclassified Colwellia TaxID=196834 RepID=UPI001C0901EE|nr:MULTISPECIES: peptidoglycan editing factor PgeF [unclassified Colwellia]MBU2925374.1 peptidoglycan editing factor PgeF [Colwellia sp. C2M11]MDO6506044.1 peptidoglycan editing factor PgeF [Colwellia sp. 5_MG-2023]MDO6554896.1 peptidoglycan editing factor PgeF [Colwellia sp. 4_MG-2023]MDO6653496.1 peptidoglycan editing factor PgeF [Colwellia sp. 3_MG-2023]MDO6666246.1 peptidoglycan editing factor PgeF [Colwellia sp. 2_MG-2023]